jgi:nucleotide-binding universal stress UspA family protein
MSYPGVVAGVIVVGVDGSPSSIAALRFAAEEARLREARIVAVHAWTYVPPPPVGEPGLMAAASADYPGYLEAERDAAEKELRAALDATFRRERDLELEERLLEGDAGEVLVAEAEEATLLVVGSRGRGELVSVLLGSVSSHVVHHATCPVVVVKAPRGSD